MWSASSVSQREGVVATPGSAHIKRDLRPPHSMVTTKAQRIQNHASHKEGFEKRFGSAQGRRRGRQPLHRSNGAKSGSVILEPLFW